MEEVCHQRVQITTTTFIAGWRNYNPFKKNRRLVTWCAVNKKHIIQEEGLRIKLINNVGNEE